MPLTLAGRGRAGLAEPEGAISQPQCPSANHSQVNLRAVGSGTIVTPTERQRIAAAIHPLGGSRLRKTSSVKAIKSDEKSADCF